MTDPKWRPARRPSNEERYPNEAAAVRAEAARLSLKAMKRLERIIDHGEDKEAVAASKLVIDRFLGKPEQATYKQVESDRTVRVLIEELQPPQLTGPMAPALPPGARDVVEGELIDASGLSQPGHRDPA